MCRLLAMDIGIAIDMDIVMLGEGITALSVYFTASASSDKCFEIAYGTTHGTVRVIIQVCCTTIWLCF